MAPAAEDDGDRGGVVDGDADDDELADEGEAFPDDGAWSGFDDGEDTDDEDARPDASFGAEGWRDGPVPGTVTIPLPGEDDLQPAPDHPANASEENSDSDDDAGVDDADGQGEDNLESEE